MSNIYLPGDGVLVSEAGSIGQSKQQITGESMKSNARWMVVLAAVSGAWLNGTMNSKAASSEEVSEATAMMSGYEAEQRAAAAARQKDAAWKPSCSEVGVIQIGDSKKPGALKNFCLNAEGNLLACFAPTAAGPNNPSGIRVYSPKGELLKTLPLEIKAGAVCVAKDGSIFVAGDGRVQKLDATGKVLASADSPVAKETGTISKETEEMDIQSHEGKLWIPHNARHAVEARDRDGKELSKFGTAGRVKATDFGGCCEPKNLRVLPNGDILAAESGPPTCIKRFSGSGKFKEVVAVANNGKGDCVRVTVEMSPDGQRYYMLDTTRDAIRSFAGKS